MKLAKSGLLLIAVCLLTETSSGQEFDGQNGRRPGKTVSSKQEETFERIQPARPLDGSQGKTPLQKGMEDKADPFDNRIDDLLNTWCSKTANVTTLYAEFTRKIADPAFGGTESSDGSARFVFPNRARLDVFTGDRAESFVMNGKNEIWHYLPPLKQLRVYHFPNTKGKELENNPVPFLVGLAPDKAKERYRFQILDSNNNFTHVKILPKLKKDQEDFKVAEVWLNNTTFFPDKLVFVEPNQNRMTFEFKKIYPNIQINEQTDFETKVPGKFEVTHVQVPSDSSGNPTKSQDYKNGSRSVTRRESNDDQLQNAYDQQKPGNNPRDQFEKQPPHRQNDDR